MRKLTINESQFTAGGNATALLLSAISGIFIAESLIPKNPNCGWQPYLREQRTPLYDAYGRPTGIDDVVTVEDYQWVCL